MPSPILCLGAINVDLKFQVDDLEGFLKDWGTGLSRGGEEAVSREDEARLTALLARYGRPAGRCGGGMAANTAYALACLGLPVGLVGRVGADADGEFLQESLAGVDLSHVVAQGESGRAYILTDREGERTILVAPNTNDDLKERDLPWEALAAATYLHLTAFVGDGPLAVQRTIAGRVPDRVRLSLDPGELYARRGWPALEDILDHLETLLVTETEWRLLGGEPKVHPNWAPPLVVIKRGALGRQTAHAAPIPGFSGGTGRRPGGHPGGRRRLRGGVPGRASQRAASQRLRAPGQPGRGRQPPGRRPGQLPGPELPGAPGPGAATNMREGRGA